MPTSMRESTGHHAVTPEHPMPRLRLRSKAAHDDWDCVDGAWWPQSDELLDELPDLLAVLAVRLGPIRRVVYDPGEWQPAPRQAPVHGRHVELLPYPSSSDSLLVVFGDNSFGNGDARVVLRVLAPDADPDSARETLIAAVASKTAVLVDSAAQVSNSN